MSDRPKAKTPLAPEKHMKHKIFIRLLIIVLSLAVVAGIVACSPRDEALTDPEIVPGTEVDIVDQVVTSEQITSDESRELVDEAMNNYREIHAAPSDPEWYVIDMLLTYDYDYFWLDENEKMDKTSSFEFEFKANMNLKDNNESQVFIQLRNSGGTPIFGLYYVENYAYFVIGSNRYYAREINFGQLGMLIYEGLGSLAESSGINLDIFGILAGLPTGSTGIALIDGILPLVSGIFFDTKDITLNSSDIDEDGNFNTQTISTSLLLNNLLTLLQNEDGLGIEGFVGIPPIWFGGIWDLVGIDLDPVLNQFLGFTLAELAVKQWQPMDARYNVITERQLVTRVTSCLSVITLYLASIGCHCLTASSASVKPRNWFKTGSRSMPTRSQIPPNQMGGIPTNPSIPSPSSFCRSVNRLLSSNEVLMVCVLKLPSSSISEEFSVMSFVSKKIPETNGKIPSINAIPVEPVGSPARIPKISRFIPELSASEPSPS